MPFKINVRHSHILTTRTDIDKTSRLSNSMKHSADAGIFQTNILQAFQKNKIIQEKLTECEHLYYIQLLKDMQTYHLQEKYNRELLYAWKKESYVRQLRKSLQEYEQKRYGVKDAYYEYQMRNLGNIIAGQQSVVIPPSEEDRRLNVNAKYHQFLRRNPLQSSSIRVVKSANISGERSNDKEDDDKEENIPDSKNIPDSENTWNHIHAQSAVGVRRKQNNILPNIHRSSTMDDIPRKKVLTESLVSPSVAVVSNTTTSGIVNSTSGEKFQRSPRLPIKSSSNYFGSSGTIEPLLMTSETLDNYTRDDLVTMRSVRRPRKDPSDLNLIFETRKRIYQINKRALDHQLLQRKSKLLSSIQFDRTKQIDSIPHTEKLLDDVNKNDHKHLSNEIIT